MFDAAVRNGIPFDMPVVSRPSGPVVTNVNVSFSRNVEVATVVIGIPPASVVV